MKDVKTIIKALRCSSTPRPQCDHDCPYYKTASEEEINLFLKRAGERRDAFPVDFFSGCDTDQIALDAADILEGMAK